MRAIYVSVPPARRILDFGCGTGWVIAEAQTKGNPQRVGVDCSLESLQTAHRRYSDIGFAAADGLQLPFSDNTFDVVVGHVSTPYMNTDKALREIHRVMSPGGSFFLTFHAFFYLRRRFLNSLRTRNWKDVLFMVYVAANGALNHLGLKQMQLWWKPSVFETVNTPAGVARAAQTHGFDLVATEHAIDRIFFAVTGRKPNPDSGAVLAPPGWSICCPLAEQFE